MQWDATKVRHKSAASLQNIFSYVWIYDKFSFCHVFNEIGTIIISSVLVDYQHWNQNKIYKLLPIFLDPDLPVKNWHSRFEWVGCGSIHISQITSIFDRGRSRWGQVTIDNKWDVLTKSSLCVMSNSHQNLPLPRTYLSLWFATANNKNGIGTVWIMNQLHGVWRTSL